jgi:hypothetical protein
MQYKFRATVQNGKWLLFEPDKFRIHCSQFEGQEIGIIVEKFRKPRSNNQNAYYWGVVLSILAKQFGYSEDEMHEALKQLFLTDKTQVIPKVRNTSSLNTLEMEDFLSRVRTWASLEHNCYIPLPNEANF